MLHLLLWSACVNDCCVVFHNLYLFHCACFCLIFADTKTSTVTSVGILAWTLYLRTPLLACQASYNCKSPLCLACSYQACLYLSYLQPSVYTDMLRYRQLYECNIHCSLSAQIFKHCYADRDMSDLNVTAISSSSSSTAQMNPLALGNLTKLTKLWVTCVFLLLYELLNSCA